MKVRNSKGFTLAELLIVMAIVVVLAAVAVPTFGRQMETARETSDMELVRNCYEEVLTVVTLDALDGNLNMKKGAATTDPAITYKGLTFEAKDEEGTAVTDGLTGTYTFTFANMDATPKMTQGTPEWQFVTNKLFGVEVGSAATSRVEAKNTGLKFVFNITNQGTLKLLAVEAVN